MTIIQREQNKPMNSDTVPPEFKILIIDDEEDFREALAFSLSQRKIDVYEAESGYDAIEALKKNNFDLILLDFNMPGLDGLETFRKISTMKNNVFVIIMTAYSENEQEREIEVLKMMNPYGILRKPFSLSKLIPFIKQRVEERGKK